MRTSTEWANHPAPTPDTDACCTVPGWPNDGIHYWVVEWLFQSRPGHWLFYRDVLALNTADPARAPRAVMTGHVRGYNRARVKVLNQVHCRGGWQVADAVLAAMGGSAIVQKADEAVAELVGK